MRKLLITILLSIALHGITLAQAPNPLFIPDTLVGPVINLNLAPSTKQFLSGDATETYGINGPFLGPTLILRHGDPVQLNVTNSLSDTSTMHWHGMHVPAMYDGGPHTPIAPGATWSPSFTVLDEACTMWYHPHLHQHTAEQVYKGAAGMIIIHDSLSATLGLPHRYGIDDFPIIIQDKSFDSLTHDFIFEALSDTIMVNGTLNAYLEVPAQMVRFRVLNGSNQRVYNLGFPSQNLAFQVASDGGFFEHPLPVTRIQLAPGERTELVVNFTNQTTNFPLMANNSEMGTGVSGGPQGPGGGPGNPLDGNNFPLMEFRLKPPTANPITTLPANLRTYHIPRLQDVARTRTKVFTVDSVGFPYYINGLIYDHHVTNDTVVLGDVEIWELINTSDIAHPFHIHDVQFHVIEKNGAPPMDHLAGRKDVILLQPNDTIKFITRFEDFADDEMPYMFHCHNLFHEDGGMMGAFIVRDSVLSGHVDSASFWSNVTLFPNPTGGSITVLDRNPHNKQIDLLEVWDLAGRKLEVVDMVQGAVEHHLDLDRYPAGMYLLHLHCEAGGHAVMRMVRK